MAYNDWLADQSALSESELRAKTEGHASRKSNSLFPMGPEDHMKM